MLLTFPVAESSAAHTYLKKLLKKTELPSTFLNHFYFKEEILENSAIENNENHITTLNPPEEDDHYFYQSKNNSELNSALWFLISTYEMWLTVPILMNALGPIDPFNDFDEETWALLHIISHRCSQEARAVIFQRIYIWLLSADSTMRNALQARLFLMSQPGFNLPHHNHDIFMMPLYGSQDPWIINAMKESANAPYNTSKEFLFKHEIKDSDKIKSLLMNLLALKNKQNMGEQILCALNYPIPFDNFDTFAWPLLFKAISFCSHESRHLFRGLICVWLPNASEKIRSQPFFSTLVTQTDKSCNSTQISESVCHKAIQSSIINLFKKQIAIYENEIETQALDRKVKRLKIDFLSFILEDFQRNIGKRPGEAFDAYMPRIFFISVIYESVTREGSVNIKQKGKSENITETQMFFNRWLKEYILIGTGTISILSHLPENYFSEIFSGTNVTLDAIMQELSPNRLAANDKDNSSFKDTRLGYFSQKRPSDSNPTSLAPSNT